jgi:hypothetical protein
MLCDLSIQVVAFTSISSYGTDNPNWFLLNKETDVKIDGNFIS